MVCKAGYVVKSNRCVSIQNSEIIENCKIYFTLSDKSNQQAKSFLSQGKSKLNLEDLEEDKIYCHACESGYYEESPSTCT